MQNKKFFSLPSLEFRYFTIFLFLLQGTAMLLSAQSYDARDVVMTPGSSESEMNFNWYSQFNTASLAQVAPKSEMQGTTFPTAAAASYNCDTCSAAPGYYSNKTVVTDLLQDTEYVYRLGDGSGHWTGNYYFTTYQNTNFSFLAVGDPQIGAGGTYSDTIGWENTLEAALTEFPDTAFLMSAGDQVESASNESHFSGFFSPSEIKSLPVVPALGNHDNGAYNTSYHFNLPNMSTQYGVTNPGIGDYYFRYGDALFLIINSNNSSGASHESFISDSIAAHPEVMWKIVMFHHDIYGSAYHALQSSMLYLRAALFPVFDTYGIDIAITGHDHSYTRTHVMREDIPRTDQDYTQDGAVIDPDGTVYFTLNSGSGSKYYTLNMYPANYVAARSQCYTPTFSRITIDGNTLDFNTYMADSMTMIDSFSIFKTSPTPPPTPEPQTPTPSTGPQTREYSIDSSRDDAEERSNGSILLTSDDLEMVYDRGDQVVGLRFTGVNIPNGATIGNSYIQFKADESHWGTTNLMITAHKTGDSAPFSTTTNDISNRTQTDAIVNWNPPAWSAPGDSGPAQRTPDLSAVIQEVIDLPAWDPDNALSFIITGSGERVAESYDANPSDAPLLHIEF